MGLGEHQRKDRSVTPRAGDFRVGPALWWLMPASWRTQGPMVSVPGSGGKVWKPPLHGEGVMSVFGKTGTERGQNGESKKGLGRVSAKPLIFLARPARFERATYGFVVRHSIQLSYGRLWNGGYLAKSKPIGKRKTPSVDLSGEAARRSCSRCAVGRVSPVRLRGLESRHAERAPTHSPDKG